MNIIKSKVLPLVIVVIVAVGAYLIGGVLMKAPQPGAAVAGTTSAGLTVPVQYQQDTVTTLYDRVKASVVEIEVTDASSGIFGMQGGVGSGFLVDSEGDIITNNHVVNGAVSVRVILDDGTPIDATIVATDPVDDLALIHVNPDDLSGATPLTLGDSDAVQPGQMAVAMGAPFGLNDTITVGIISGVNRTVDGSSSSLVGMLQTDAAISPGNSGGPLFNAAGEVIGVNTAIEASSGANDIGFAIPSNVVSNVLATLKAGETVERPWLGIRGLALTEHIADQLGLDASQGVYVVDVIADGPAAAAGLVPAPVDESGTPTAGGDIITGVDGQDVTTVQAISSYLRSRHVGDTVTLTIVRSGQTLPVKVTLGAWPENLSTTATPALPLPNGNGNGSR
jgi:S1-C subfamily serine protease